MARRINIKYEVLRVDEVAYDDKYYMLTFHGGNLRLEDVYGNIRQGLCFEMSKGIPVDLYIRITDRLDFIISNVEIVPHGQRTDLENSRITAEGKVEYKHRKITVKTKEFKLIVIRSNAQTCYSQLDITK
ncbi:hypothetical protein SCHPADRAFT_892485 [Schizopora paradoxa]|uniref:Uncharacterized protein n=1 Tax=Schizopora paradoxa TaxID=27342 RepID=A0A0H2RZS0_9AGAM|nr:hypothetical protein SCHPADRAFT_892485 [Schizopora paradoxa]